MSLSSPLKTVLIAAFLGAGLTGAAFAQDAVVTVNPVRARLIFQVALGENCGLGRAP